VNLLGNPRVLIRLQDPAEITDNNNCQQNAISDCTQEAGPVDNVQKLSEQEIQAKLTEEMEDLLSKGGINPLIEMSGMYLVHISQNLQVVTSAGFNMHLDTPMEIVHTVLLGVVKYYWAQTIWYLKNCSKSLDLFQIHLASVEWNGLNAPSTDAAYICQYHGSLIGKHFKGLAQVMLFLVYDLVPEDVLRAWNIIGALVVLLWHTEIEDAECYLVRFKFISFSWHHANMLQSSLTQIIGDFLNIMTKCSPSILISKPKFHFLIHLPAFIWHFGPAILFSTERYKSFNHVFCLSCIYSNHQAPSCDSCNTFTAQDHIKRIATGGYWLDTDTGVWVQAGQTILDYMSTHDEALSWLGLPKESKLTPGEFLITYLLLKPIDILQGRQNSSTSQLHQDNIHAMYPFPQFCGARQEHFKPYALTPTLHL
jgi:hypothetical protein